MKKIKVIPIKVKEGFLSTLMRDINTELISRGYSCYVNCHNKNKYLLIKNRDIAICLSIEDIHNLNIVIGLRDIEPIPEDIFTINLFTSIYEDKSNIDLFNIKCKNRTGKINYHIINYKCNVLKKDNVIYLIEKLLNIIEIKYTKKQTFKLFYN